MQLGWPQVFVTIVTLASGGGAVALGLGEVRSSVTLGQPLNVAVPVTLADGETLGSECASADVIAGDAKMAPGSVRVRVTQGRDSNESILRISTTSVVDEPVLTVTVSAGCPTRISRTLVLLADPPLVSTATAPAETQTLATVAAPAPAAQPATAVDRTATTSTRVKRPVAPSRRSQAFNAKPARSVIAAAAPAASAASAPARSAPATAARTVARAEPKSRLQLEVGQVNVDQVPALAAQQQASAAQASASAAEAAASAAGDRIRSIEAELARVRAESKAQTDALLQLRQQLSLDREQRDQPSPWLMALLGLAALLAGVAVWLGWRLRKQSQLQQSADWWDRSAASVAPSMAQSQASDFQESQRPAKVSAMQRLPSAPAPWSDSTASQNGGVDVLISPMTVPAPTAVTIPPIAAPSARDEEANRAMSVDEQIDLEQQADFFIALGHDDAAIDLLMAHMRSTGGGSPLPFLKLLEIHRRRGQREAYERTRVRFNQRFNSVAPDWQADPKAGRALEDYPLAIGRIQRAWPSPLDAMAELEALLFRRGAGAELFDLPAYQEVLFLYQMARDLHQADDNTERTADVDVLLPIGGRSAPMVAPEGTIVLRPEFNDGEPLALDLDLDLPTRHGEVPRPAAGPASVTPPVASPLDSLSLEQIDKESPAVPEDDFWGKDPDARPTR